MKYELLITSGLGLIVCNPVLIAHGEKQEQKKMNVLFIAIDDLRPELNCYGVEYMHTPNIDRLASNGVLFQNAYCQQAVSAPSRNSLLTGLRPDAIGIYNLGTFFRKNVPDVVTLPQYFKENGYRVEQVGKIYHTGHGNSDDSLSWSVPKWNPDKILGKVPAISRKDTTELETDFPKIDNKLLPYYASNAPEEDMSDARNVTVAIERLKELKDSTFFMAVGFVKPHLPFATPKKYWDMYDADEIEIPERKTPENMSSYAMDLNFGELRKYYGVPAEGQLDDDLSRSLIHGYRACVSFIDAQVGRLLDALEENQLLDNTVIVLWGDHGWKLGEYGAWCKHSNMELDVNAPLIVSYPGCKSAVTESIVEFVDVYPTICDLAGLRKPAHLQGTSLVPVLEHPDVDTHDFAISQYPREKHNRIMGYSIRYGKYRYTCWVKFNSQNKEIVEQELYEGEDGKIAKRNLAYDKNYKGIVKKLDKILYKELLKTPVSR